MLQSFSLHGSTEAAASVHRRQRRFPLVPSLPQTWQRPAAISPNCHQGASSEPPRSQSLCWCGILCFVGEGGGGTRTAGQQSHARVGRYTRLSTAAHSRTRDGWGERGRGVHPRAQGGFKVISTSLTNSIDASFLPKLRLKCTFVIR